MKPKLLIFFLLIFLGCKSEKESKHTNFVFSDSGLHHNYSVKFSNNDTLFLERRFPTPKEHFYCIISLSDKEIANELIKKIEFSKYDSIYMQDNLSDGNTFQFFKMQKSQTNSIVVYGDEAPKELYSFYSAFRNLKDKQKFFPIKTNQNFGNLRYFMLPPPPPPMPKITAGNSCL